MIKIFTLKKDKHDFVRLVTRSIACSVPLCCNESEKAVRLVNDVFGLSESAVERVIVVYMTSDCSVLGVSEVGRGNNHTAMVCVSTVFKVALLCNATFFIMLHNHPSGNCKPSKEDLQLTKKIASVGSVLNIPLMDHLIIGGNGYWAWSRSREER